MKADGEINADSASADNILSADVEKILSECRELCSAPGPDGVADAIRLSGESLAHVDNKWRLAHNSGQNRSYLQTLLRDMAALAVCHAGLLADTGMSRDAYGVLAMTLTAMVMDTERDGLEFGKFTVATSLLTATLALAETLDTADDFNRQHFCPLLTYAGTIAYSLYKSTLEHNGATSLHREITPSLRDMIAHGYVSYPEIEVNGKTVNADCLDAILSDLLGHAAALELICGN